MNEKLLPYINNFKKISLDKRLEEVEFIKNKYFNQIPIIMDTFEKKLNLKKNKYLVPSNLVMSQFFYYIRNNHIINSKESIFVLCNNKLINMYSILGELYLKEKEEDNFLYFILKIEDTFG